MDEARRRMAALAAAGIDISMMTPVDIVDLPVPYEGTIKLYANLEWQHWYETNPKVRAVYDSMTGETK